MNMRRSSRRRDAAVGRGRRRGAWALFVAGVAYVSVLAFLRSAAAPASRPPAFVLPPPEPWDPSRLRPPHALDAARRGAAVPRATGGGAAPDAGDPLAALRAASREALGAPRARAAPGRASDRGASTVFVAGLPLSGSDAVADLVAAARGGNATAAPTWAEAEARAARRADVVRVPGAPPANASVFARLAASAALARRSACFVVVLRHPLAWAVSLGLARSTTSSTDARTAARSRGYRGLVAFGDDVVTAAAFWTDAAGSLVSECLGGVDCVVAHSETLVDDGVARALLRAVPGVGAAATRTAAAGCAASGGACGSGGTSATLGVPGNAALVRCWLRGVRWHLRLGRCERERAEYTEEERELATSRHIDFWTVKRRHECGFNAFGYSLRGFEPLLSCSKLCAGGVRAAAAAPPLALPLVAPPLARRSAAVAFARANGSMPDSTATDGATLVGDVIVAFFKVYHGATSAGGRGGMFARMAQVVRALADTGLTVHFICHCEMPPPHLVDRSWAPAGTRFYAGGLQQQLDQMLPYACAGGARGDAARAPVKALFLFVTSLTVDMHFRAAVKRARFWWKEPKLGALHSERVASRVLAHSPALRVVVLTDDVHHVRAAEAFADVRQPLNVAAMLAWLKRRELALYASAHDVLTVSLEDARAIEDGLALEPSLARGGAEPPRLSWAPFVRTDVAEDVGANGTNASAAAVAAAAAAARAGRRVDVADTLANKTGLVYVGMPHPLAVPAVAWLVREVLPRVAAVLRDDFGRDDAFVERHAVLYVAGGGDQAQRWRRATRGAPEASKARVRLVGALSDVGLAEELLVLRRVFVAPLFNNTGIATKIVNAMSHGLPVVTTPGGCRGLGLPADASRALLVAADAAAFARHAARLLVDDALWRDLSRGGRRHVEENLSRDALARVVRDAVSRAFRAPEPLADAEARPVVSRAPPGPVRGASDAPRRARDATCAALLAEGALANPSVAALPGGRRRFAARLERRDGSPGGLVVGDATEDGFAACVAVPDPVSAAAGFEPCRGAAERGGADEPRVFAWRGGAWVLFAARPACVAGARGGCPWCADGVTTLSYVARLDDARGGGLVDPARPVIAYNAGLGATQRAFAPFVGVDGELYLAVAVEPQSVLRVNATATFRGRPIAAARRVAVASSDELWADARALDGGCRTRPPLLAATPAILVDRRPPAAWPSSAAVAARPAASADAATARAHARGALAGRVYFLAVARGHVETGCLRFYEHYAYAFQAAPPFAVLARSERALPLAGRSYAPASQPECQPSVAWRVQAGRAKTVAGAARNATHVFLSYSAGADWTSREWAAPLDAVEETLVPVAPSVAERLTPCARDDASPDCAVLWAAAASCRGGAQF